MAAAAGAAAGATNLNVLKTPLTLFSRSPMTGFYRDGYCRVGPDDPGNHAIAGILSKEFLDFTASRGNNLRAAGLTPGCKWCLCTARWKEAVDAAAGSGGGGESIVPKVYLQATDQSALKKVDLELLKKYAADESDGGDAAAAREL